MVCFDWKSERSCEEFDGEKAKKLQRTEKRHAAGGLGLYNNQPTVVGGWLNDGEVETLTKEGWIPLPPHPKFDLK